MNSLPSTLSDEAKSILLSALPLSPPQRRVLERAWPLAEKAESLELLNRATFPADHAPTGDARKSFGVAEATTIAWIVSIVWAATRSLMTMSQKFVDGKDPGPGLPELLAELRKVPDLDQEQAASVASKLQALVEKHASRR